MGRLPDASLLRQLLQYEPETGHLVWRERSPEHFNAGGKSAAHTCAIWNKRWATKRAFTALRKGYFQGSLLGKNYDAHRVIWKLVTGVEAVEIDHENGVKSDNRWGNLAEKDHTGNMRNMPIPSHNTSGVMGVIYCKTYKKWVAILQIAPGRRRVRYCKSKDEAILKRKMLEAEYGFHKNHGRRAA